MTKSWDISIKWKEEATEDEIASAQDFVRELNDNVNDQRQGDVPDCVQSVLISRGV